MPYHFLKNMGSGTIFVFAALVLICPHLLQASEVKITKVCPHFFLEGSESLSFTTPEQLLICGDPHNPAWSSIPSNQAMFSMRGFLQDRGYFSPEFENRKGVIYVRLGDPTVVTELRTEGEPLLPVDRLRNILGERLTPSLLDSTKDRLRAMLESRGYPCSDIQIEADPHTGVILAHVYSGPRQSVFKVTEEHVPGLELGMMSRYWAFQLGEPYNSDLFTVTSRRIIDAGLIQGTFYMAKCLPEGASVHQQITPGPPRQVTIGAGIDTEQLFILRANWKNSRVGKSGSLVSLTANNSWRIQEFMADGRWYFEKKPSRHFIQPTLDVKRDNERTHEFYNTSLRLAPGTSWDNNYLGLTFSGGPALSWIKTVRGAGVPSVTFLSLGTHLTVNDHYFEFFRTSPRRGFNVDFYGDFTNKHWGSPFTAQSLRANMEALWNLGHLDPPSLVIGFRSGLWTTLTNESTPTSTLPNTYLQFLGGSSDLRGFYRQELPPSLTAAFAGLELRLNSLLPWGLQPFIFADAGFLGKHSLGLDWPLLWDPGLGIRWQAPFGVIRTTIAHGEMAGNTSGLSENLRHWQFYFSFGEEF